MTNGANHPGAIFVGDLDAWTFTANQGDSIVLSVGEVLVSEVDPIFQPLIRLVGPAGAQVGFDSGNLVAQVNATAPLSGTYTVLVSDSNINREASHAGSYLLTLFRTPAAFTVPAGDEGGAMTNGANHAGTIHIGDVDAWFFTANQGDFIALSI
jgi:hypothetical protein